MCVWVWEQKGYGLKVKYDFNAGDDFNMADTEGGIMINYASIQRRVLLGTPINVGLPIALERLPLIGQQNMVCEHLIREVQRLHGERRFPSG